jgi:hypothetical protein
MKNAGNKRVKKESRVTTKNNRFKQDFLDDLRKDGIVDGVHIARVLKMFSKSRMEVFYVKPIGDKGDTRGFVGQAVTRGLLRRSGARAEPIGVDSFVALVETGLGGSASLEIVAVFSREDIRDIAREFNVDPRVMAIGNTDSTQLLSSKMTLSHDAGYEFDTIEEDDEEDVDVDNI